MQVTFILMADTDHVGRQNLFNPSHPIKIHRAFHRIVKIRLLFEVDVVIMAITSVGVTFDIILNLLGEGILGIEILDSYLLR